MTTREAARELLHCTGWRPWTSDDAWALTFVVVVAGAVTGIAAVIVAVRRVRGRA